MNAFQQTDPELTHLIQDLYKDSPFLFQGLLPRSEVESLQCATTAVDNNEDSSSGEGFSLDKAELTADTEHIRPAAIGCFRPQFVRSQLKWPLREIEMDAIFKNAFAEAYRRDYATPMIIHFGKVPLQWCKKLAFTDRFVISGCSYSD